MRLAFIRSLIKAAEKEERIFLLSGDLGYAALEPFIEKFPKRFLNMGVAEQNMVGFAAGLALSGKIPVVYSIATFATLKTIEQIRNDVCYQNLNVKIVGVGSGLTYSQYGSTHQSMEDIAVMRVLPHMKVICPGDPVEVEKAVEAILKDEGPCYLRLGAKGEPRIVPAGVEFEIGKSIVIQDGRDVALVSTGNMLQNTVAAAKVLEGQGINPKIISMHTVKPLDRELLEEIFRDFEYIFTIEEHSLIGGLGSAVAELVAECKSKDFIFKRIAVEDKFQDTAGWLDYTREKNHLSPQGIAKIVIEVYNKSLRA